MLTEEIGPDGFVLRDAVPTSDVIRIRFADIDGLRAIAILLVGFAIVAHATLRALPAPALHVASEASQGITLFFVLSGFVLAFPALAVLRQDGRTYLDIGRYAIRRVLRLYPTYAVVVGLTVGVALLAPRLTAAALGYPTVSGLVPNLLFFGDGFGNEGIRVVALFARASLVFPVLLVLWSKRPALFALLALAVAAADVFTPAHAVEIGAFFPFMLGIVAADVRAQRNRLERLAPLIVVLAAAGAIAFEPRLASFGGAQSAPSALRIDPFWSLAAFGLVVTAGAFRPLERAFGFWMLRVLGSASYAISLIAIPTCALLALAGRVGSAFTAPAVLGGGFLLWQCVDRWFGDETFRRAAANALAGPFDEALRIVRADRVFLGRPADPIDDDIASDEPEEAFVPTFYAPPPRADAADLAIVSRRTGSPGELAAEILETKARLQERSAALFADPPPPPPPPPTYAKPGFYRKPAPAVQAGVSMNVNGANGTHGALGGTGAGITATQIASNGISYRSAVAAASNGAAASGSAYRPPPAPPAPASIVPPRPEPAPVEPKPVHSNGNGNGHAIRIRIAPGNGA